MAQKYVVVHFIDSASVPAEFSARAWPLHITLLANFTIGPELSRLQNQLAQYAASSKSIDLVADGEAQFGEQKNVAVSLIRPDQPIVTMHKKLLAITSEFGAVYDEPTFTNDGYRPHATIQSTARLHDGQIIRMDNFTLVDMFPHDDIGRRAVMQTYWFTA
jgi:2'-5' RNA ligase